jgi:predicted nucleic-acid-binding Zn-ribbon protein
MVYLMLCPKCGCVLAEWDSLEARGKELSEFAKKLKLPHAQAI